MTIEAVLFDLDDTLHNDTLAFARATEDVARDIAGIHAIDRTRLAAAFLCETAKFWDSQLSQREADPRNLAWHEALKAIGITDLKLAQKSARDFEIYRSRYFELFPGALELIRDLRNRNIKAALLTNGMRSTHKEKIAALGIAPHVDAVFLSGDVGMAKPDPRIFHFACRSLNSLPSATVMVGDRYDKDCIGALEAGLVAVWLNVRGEPLPSGAVTPHATVYTLAEAGKVLLELMDEV